MGLQGRDEGILSVACVLGPGASLLDQLGRDAPNAASARSRAREVRVPGRKEKDVQRVLSPGFGDASPITDAPTVYEVTVTSVSSRAGKALNLGGTMSG